MYNQVGIGGGPTVVLYLYYSDLLFQDFPFPWGSSSPHGILFVVYDWKFATSFLP